MLIAALTFLLYFFREHVSRARKLLVLMAGSVYTVYIIHQTIVIASRHLSSSRRACRCS